MLKAVRVEKHPDHGCDTLFRLFLDGELSCNFFVYDEVADELERLLNGEAERQRDELLALLNRIVAEAQLALIDRGGDARYFANWAKDEALAAIKTIARARSGGSGGNDA